MAIKFLDQHMIDAGRKLVEDLCHDLTMEGAVWLKYEDKDTYRLIIAAKEVENQGSHPVYGIIQTALRRLPSGDQIPFDVVTVRGPSMEAIAKAYRIDRGRREEPLPGAYINGDLVEDGYAYFLEPLTAVGTSGSTE